VEERNAGDMVAIVAGGTREAGRGIAVELGHVGGTVYVTGRSTREARSPMDRPETIEETAELVSGAGGTGIAVQVDHSQPDEVESLMRRVDDEQGGRLDLLVNDVWGGDRFIEWGRRFWEHRPDGIHALRQAIETHVITSRYAVPLLLKRGKGLLLEINDGTGEEGYRGNLFYDLAKYAVVRLAFGEAYELRRSGITVVCLTPGFLRSEEVLDAFGVTEDNWREAATGDKNTTAGHFAASETPRYIGRAVSALAADPEIARYHGRTVTTGTLAREFGFTDLDGSQPDFHSYFAEFLESEGKSYEEYVDGMTMG
jgi:NAD(P)-dependent dehydrogenase (short-subunit alcohol dehydrogenase family)